MEITSNRSLYLEKSVEDRSAAPLMDIRRFCDLLQRSHLLADWEIRQVRSRWAENRGPGPNDLEAFTHWLIEHHYLTPFQVRRLLDGHPDHFFFDQYKILGRIGKGTVAKVYKAVSRDGQVVALKVIPPSLLRDSRFREGFLRGTAEAARLHHPHLVRILHAGEDEGLHYVALEYLDGETLAEVLVRRVALPVPEAVRLTLQALDGLQHLHERGQVHGNLEPANLMIVPRPTSGGPDSTLEASLKILDIGMGNILARAAGEAAANLRSDGRSQLAFGTEDVAPERARADGAYDIRADLYSLGCILHHCLAGRPPFPDRNPFRQLVRHATEEPPSLVALVPTVPPGLEQAIRSMMAKNPADRPATPAEAARLLAPFAQAVAPLAEDPVAVPAPSPELAPPLPDSPLVDAPLPLEAGAPVTPEAYAVAAPHAPEGRRLTNFLLLVLAILIGALPSWFVFLYVKDSLTGQRKKAEPPRLVRQENTDFPEKTKPADPPKVKVPPVGKEPPPPGEKKPKTAIENPEGKEKKEGPPPSKEQPSPKKEPSIEKKKEPEKKEPTPKKEPALRIVQPPLPARILGKKPIPAEANQARAEALIKKLFADEYARTTPQDLRALADKLLQHGVDTLDDPAARFVLFREAIDLAARGGDVKVAESAQERFLREYALETLPLRCRTLASLVRNAPISLRGKDLIAAAFRGAEDAVLVDDYASAASFLDHAEAAARKLPSVKALKEVAQRREELKEIQARHAELRAKHPAVPALLVPEAPLPGDPSVLGRAGVFLCFLKGEWERGLPLLALGEEPFLQELAGRELAGPDDPLHQVQIADAWIGFAATQEGTARTRIRAHAADWYRRALPMLKGLTRTRVERALQDLGE